MSKSPIIITGMHRSGTTLLTKLLEQCGIFLGSKKFMNEEAIFFQDINRWLLYQSNTAWDAPQAFSFINDSFQKQALKAIEWRMNSYHIKEYLGIMKGIKYRSLRKIDFDWGWKDPVNSITLDLWMQAFPEARIVNIIRNPIDVASSLKAREEKRIALYSQRKNVTEREKKLVKKPVYNQSYRVLDLKEGIDLALSYMHLNQMHLAKYPSQAIQLNYEQLLSNPTGELQALLTFLDIPVTENSLAQATSMVQQDNGYKFVNEPGMKQIFQELNLEAEFDAFGFKQPDFLI